ncbi:MAG TPA: AMP-binding protein [Ramlibacter sp.]|nr:AMP-binding protein [Ramlibacter sp.]
MTQPAFVDRWSTREQMTLLGYLESACARTPDKIFLDFSGNTLTYRQFDIATSRLARGLQRLGVQAGDRVSCLLDNVLENVVGWFAVNKLRAVFVPVNTALKGDFLQHQIKDADGEILLVEADYVDRVVALESELPRLKTLVVRGDHALPQSRLTCVPFAEVPEGYEGPVGPMPATSDLALLMYTSGTTGASKGCMVSHSYAARAGRQMAANTCMTAEDIAWTPCPLFHSAAVLGLVANVLTVGATASIYRRFSASEFWPEIERSKATAVLLVSTMLTIIPAAPDTPAARRCFGQLRLVWGAPLSGELIQKWKERFGPKHVSMVGYSMSEAFTMIYKRVDSTDVPDGAAGRRYPDFDVKVVDDNDNECPPGVAGEVMVRPMKPGIMFQGYWRRPEATLAAMRDLWFHTGDIGKFDEKGFFYFVDRKKDYLRRGGENISSFEVEAVFLKHEAIAEVAVHAVKSDLSEDEVKLTAVLKEGACISEAELCEWSENRLPKFAVPRYIEYRQSLPRTPSNRVQKFLLKDEGVTASTWDRLSSRRRGENA